MLLNTGKYEKLFLLKVFYRNKQKYILKIISWGLLTLSLDLRVKSELSKKS